MAGLAPAPPATLLAALDRLATEGWAGPGGRSPGDPEVLDTLRAMAELQARYGPDACRRYVVSFSRSAADLAAVRALARLAVPDGSLELDVVPLFESKADLERAGDVLDEYLALPGRLPGWSAGAGASRSCSATRLGQGRRLPRRQPGLYKAQGGLAAWAAARGIDLVLFHGRGGALGRGGGPAGRAVRRPGPWVGRRALQGHRAGRGHLRPLRQPGHRPPPPGAGHQRRPRRLDPGAQTAVAAARTATWPPPWPWPSPPRRPGGLVEKPGFAEFFAKVTPIKELGLAGASGPGPACRSGAGNASGTSGLADLRAIPWVFAWSQNRCNLPGWYGLGTGLEVVAHRPQGLALLREMYAEWPLFRSLIENAEMSLAKADPRWPSPTWSWARPDLVAAIREEFRRTRALVTETTGAGAARPPAGAPPGRRPPQPLCRRLVPPGPVPHRPAQRAQGEEAARAAGLVLLTVNGVAAGLQNTG